MNSNSINSMNFNHFNEFIQLIVPFLLFAAYEEPAHLRLDLGGRVVFIAAFRNGSASGRTTSATSVAPFIALHRLISCQSPVSFIITVNNQSISNQFQFNNINHYQLNQLKLTFNNINDSINSIN